MPPPLDVLQECSARQPNEPCTRASECWGTTEPESWRAAEFRVCRLLLILFCCSNGYDTLKQSITRACDVCNPDASKARQAVKARRRGALLARVFRQDL